MTAPRSDDPRPDDGDPYGSAAEYGSAGGYGPAGGPGSAGGYGPAPYGTAGQAPVDQQDTLWSVLVHLSVFVFPLIAPLVVYLVFRDTSPFTRHHAAEALNFHITLALASIVSFVLIIVIIGFFLLLAVSIAGAVLGIVAAIAASRRELYRYPLTLRLIS